MPNHVTHRMIVEGEPAAVEAFKKRHIVAEGGGEGRKAPRASRKWTFDFETVIPMPPILRLVDKGSETDEGLIVLGHDEPKAIAMLNYPSVKEAGVTSLEELRAFLRKERGEKVVERAELALQAERETGFRDWYDWSVAKWGTKWNAYDFEAVAAQPGRYEFTFNTAWSPAEPVFARLAELHPTLKFAIMAFDEGENFAFVGTAERGVYAGKLVDASSVMRDIVFDGQHPKSQR